MSHEEVLYPDWKQVADDWDGVHMAARAVAATQGICFEAGEQRLAAPYWSVESTLWLRWSFDGVEHVATIERCGSG